MTSKKDDLARVLEHAGLIDLEIDQVRLQRLRAEGTPALSPELPTFKGSGLLPGVDLDDRSALLDRMDDLDEV
jgi:hypothetical protein